MGFALKKEYLPHYTIEEWELWEGEWELIDGVPYAMSPQPSTVHQRLNGKLWSLFNEAMQQCGTCEALLPINWKISDGTIIHPDLSVFCEKVDDLYVEQIPELIVEILSPSTKVKDKTLKFDLYQLEKVGYYLIIDPIEKKVEVYKLTDGKYVLLNDDLNGNFNFTLSKCAFDFNFSKIW